MKKIFSVFTTALVASILVSSCSKERGAITKTIDLALKPNQAYSYTIPAAGDADDQMEITSEPQHASLINLNVTTTREATISYTPAKDYTGSDLIEVKNVEHHQGGFASSPHPGGGNCQGRHHHDDDVTYIFRITIKEDKPIG